MSQGTFLAMAFNTWPKRPVPPFPWGRREGRQVAIPPIRQLAPLHQLKLLRQLPILFLVFLVARVPGLVLLAPAPAKPVAQALADSIGYQEFGVLRPAVEPFGKANLVFTQRLAMAAPVSCL